MKVLLISDLSIDQNPGGAQVSNHLIIQEGIKLGHDVIEFNINSPSSILLNNYDVVISSNLNLFLLNRQNVIHYILNHKNHVRLEHDSCLYFQNSDRERLFSHSKMNFFLSNFHINFFQESYGDYFNNVQIVYDPIDTNLFCKDDCEKIYDIVYCGFLFELKGYKNLIQFAKDNPDRKIDIFGWSEQQEVVDELKYIKNIELHSRLSYNDISKIYKQSKYIYHSPMINEPFCRMVAEALLCGCDFIGDKTKIGSIQEFEKVGYEKFKYNCENAAEIFWNKLK